MSVNPLVEMNLDKLEKERGISRYKAVLMAAQEARHLTDQALLGIIDLGSEKATTVALRHLYEGSIVEIDDEGLEK